MRKVVFVGVENCFVYYSEIGECWKGSKERIYVF